MCEGLLLLLQSAALTTRRECWRITLTKVTATAWFILLYQHAAFTFMSICTSAVVHLCCRWVPCLSSHGEIWTRFGSLSGIQSAVGQLSFKFEIPGRLKQLDIWAVLRKKKRKWKQHITTYLLLFCIDADAAVLIRQQMLYSSFNYSAVVVRVGLYSGTALWTQKLKLQAPN